MQQLKPAQLEVLEGHQCLTFRCRAEVLFHIAFKNVQGLRPQAFCKSHIHDDSQCCTNHFTIYSLYAMKLLNSVFENKAGNTAYKKVKTELVQL